MALQAMFACFCIIVSVFTFKPMLSSVFKRYRTMCSQTEPLINYFLMHVNGTIKLYSYFLFNFNLDLKIKFQLMQRV